MPTTAASASPVRKAEPVSLAPHAHTREAAHRALLEGHAHLTANLDLPSTGPHAEERVHQLRVALRRLRTHLRTFRSALGRAPTAALARALRWLFRCLGRLRDLQQLAASPLLGALQARSRKRVHAALAARIATAAMRVEQALASPRCARMLLQLEAMLHASAEQGNGERAAERLARHLGKLQKRVRRRARAVARGGLAELHALRKDLKRLRYTAELALPLFPARQKRGRKLLKAVASLQDAAGAWVDLRVALGTLTRLGAGDAEARLSALAEHTRAQLVPEISARAAALCEAKRFWA